MRIAVVTASLPERHKQRAECVESVASQTLSPVMHLVAIDYERVGPAGMLNRMLPSVIEADADWIAQVADDDILYPNHLETLAAHSRDADIIYPYCDVDGRDWNPNHPYDPAKLRTENYIPATTLIRTSLAVSLNGWTPEYGNRCEDWNFWKEAQSIGARFVCVPERTWLYRFHGSNQSWNAG